MLSKSIFVLVAGFSALNLATAASCIVVGDKTAVVKSSAGEKSPVFLTNDCASLRSISGKAMVSWVSKDGKVSFAPIGPNGPERQPMAGSEERSGNVVWAELSSTRQTRRPAFMRAFGDEKAVPVYVPEAGILIKPKVGESVKVLSVEDGVETLVMDSSKMQPFLITRATLKPGSTYQLEWTNAGNIEKEKWKILESTELLRLDTQYKEVQDAELDQEQRKVITAMLFEQLKLLTNMRIVLSSNLDD